MRSDDEVGGLVYQRQANDGGFLFKDERDGTNEVQGFPRK